MKARAATTQVAELSLPKPSELGFTGRQKSQTPGS
jgi:hypothetical protein